MSAMSEGLIIDGCEAALCPPSREAPHQPPAPALIRETQFFIDDLMVRIHFIFELIWWTGLAPWEFVFPFPGSLRALGIVLL